MGSKGKVLKEHTSKQYIRVLHSRGFVHEGYYTTGGIFKSTQLQFMLSLSKGNNSLTITFIESTTTLCSSLNIQLGRKRKFMFHRQLDYIDFYNSWHHL